MVFALGLTLAAGSAGAFSLPGFGGRRPPTPPAAAPAPSVSLAAGEWPQAHSDVAPDPAIRFGALANGMRFAIVRAAAPAGAVSLRLRIAAGSMEESDSEAGLARFLERMAFEGSKAIPAAERVNFLESRGLTFGAETNGLVSFDAATYKIDLAKADDAAVDAALMVLRETASELTLDDDAVARVRAALLADQAAEDTPALRIFRDRLAFVLEGQRPASRFPSGRTDVISQITRAQLADFYARWYRPARATLIIAGDIDPAAVEVKLRARFDGWTASGPASPTPGPGPVESRTVSARLAVEVGAPTSIELAWTGPPDLSADTRARRRRELIERLGLAVLNRRLASGAQGEAPPFIAAGAFGGDELRAARVTGLLISADPGAWQNALVAAEQEQRRAVAYGVRPDELASAVADMRTELRAAAADARAAGRLADQIAGAVAEEAVETSPAEELAFFEETVGSLAADEVSAALKRTFRGAGPLIFVSSPTPVEGGEAGVRAAWLASSGRAVDAPALAERSPWPYLDFGDPSKVVVRKEVPDLDAVFVTFANGVRLTVKPTKFSDDRVMVKVRLGRGLEALAPDRQGPGWAAAALVDGGLAKIDLGAAQHALAPAVWSAEAKVEDDAFTLTGTTRRDDLDTQLQVLAAYATDPGWRPEAVGAARSAAQARLDQVPQSASGVLDRDLPGLIHAGDRRWTFPTRADLAAATPQALRDEIGAMSAGPAEIVMVGDVTVDEAIDAVSRTFAALPVRAAATVAPPPAANFPAPNTAPVVITEAAPPTQAIGLVAWRTDDFGADPRGARAAALLADILQARLSAALTGVTVRAETDASFVWPHYGFLSATVATPPQGLDPAMAALTRICADLRDRDVAPDELDRARKARLDALAKARTTNAWWLAALSGVQGDPRRLAAIRAETGGLDQITPADLRRAAQKDLRDEAAWKLEIKPAA